MNIDEFKIHILKKVVQALLKQGMTSINAEGRGCAYRSPVGDMCAVGHLIPDELYDPDMEEGTASHVFETYPAVYKHIVEKHVDDIKNFTEREHEWIVDFFDHVQYAHDRIPPMERHHPSFAAMLQDNIETIIENEGLEVTWKQLISE